MLALALALAAPAAQAAQATPPTPDEKALLRAINEVRLARGLEPLVLSTRLQAGARSFARGMIERQSFEHASVRPGVAENRFWGAQSASGVRAIVRAWLSHADARANLLSPKVRRIGIGIALGRFLGAPAAVVAVARFSR